MTLLRCARCRRPLRHPVEVAGLLLGVTCAQKVAGSLALATRYATAGKAKRERARRAPAPPAVDPRQSDLFAEAP